MREVAIIDYGMGNLGSVSRAFEECGAENVFIAEKPIDLGRATHIVLPGVGAFSKGMQRLKGNGWVEVLRKTVLREGTPLLGICLGMQLLATKGYEGGECLGLDLIAGEVRKFPDMGNFRIPHMGWNEVHTIHDSTLLKDIDDRTDFYFVHSYCFRAEESENVVGCTPYGIEFPSVLELKNIFGVQFHPEKSQKPGFKIIRNFLAVGNA